MERGWRRRVVREGVHTGIVSLEIRLEGEEVVYRCGCRGWERRCAGEGWPEEIPGEVVEAYRLHIGEQES